MPISDDDVVRLIVLLSAVALYSGLHSLLASLRLKAFVARRWPAFMPAYRLSYNFLSVVLLLPIIWQMQQYPGPMIWQWSGVWSWLMNALALLAVIGFFLSLKSYDSMMFLGWRQWREGQRGSNDPGRLSLSGFHRYVRHPWYFFLLILMWSRDIFLAHLLIYGLISVYLVIGSRLEERKLIVEFGDAYRLYRRKVPGLVPLPWRYLSRTEADTLMDLASRETGEKKP